MARTHTFDDKVNECEVVDSDHVLFFPHFCLHGNQTKHTHHLESSQGEWADFRCIELGVTHPQKACGVVEPAGQ